MHQPRRSAPVTRAKTFHDRSVTRSGAASLTVIATPIGNLRDVSFRAVDTLRSADLIVCEDTRITKRLLDHYRIARPVMSVHEHSTPSMIQRVVEELQRGSNVAVVTDAGTPGVSDPGGMLVAAAHEAGIKVVALPGPSAVTAALSVSGLPADRFQFLGFVPHKKGRETIFKEIVSSDETVVFYESPHRIMKTLQRLSELVQPDRIVVVCRELTKVFEETVRGSAQDVYRAFTDNPGRVRGEFVIVISARKPPVSRLSLARRDRFLEC